MIRYILDFKNKLCGEEPPALSIKGSTEDYKNLVEEIFYRLLIEPLKTFYISTINIKPFDESYQKDCLFELSSFNKIETVDNLFKLYLTKDSILEFLYDFVSLSYQANSTCFSDDEGRDNFNKLANELYPNLVIIIESS